jgi:hypothetical protein
LYCHFFFGFALASGSVKMSCVTGSLAAASLTLLDPEDEPLPLPKNEDMVGGGGGGVVVDVIDKLLSFSFPFVVRPPSSPQARTGGREWVYYVSSSN